MTKSHPLPSHPTLARALDQPASRIGLTFPALPYIGMVFLGVLLLGGCTDPDSASQQPTEEVARPAKIVPVHLGGIDSIRTYPGTVEALKKADLAFRVQGQLVELPVKPGRRVKEGDLLARLDDAVYRNVLAEREAQFALVQIRYDQAQKLRKKELASQLELDQSRAELEVARALLNAARDKVTYTRLTAPFDGMVARVDPENYQTIKAQVPVIQVQDNDQLEVRFSVPESLVSQLVKVVDPRVLESYCGKVRFASRPGETFRACHKEFESVPDPLTRNYPVVFSLEPLDDFSVLPGMTVSIELDFSQFLSAEARSGLLVPVEAVFEEDGKTWIWQVDGEMRARRIAVIAGRFDDDRMQIEDGLSPGDLVIAAGVSYVREGMLVKPFVKERGL